MRLRPARLPSELHHHKPPHRSKLLKKRKKSQLVSFDWTDIRLFHTLMAAAVIKGRSVPLCWASCTGNMFEGHRRDHGAENYSRLRRIALNLLRQEKTSKASIRGKCKLAGWDHDYLLKYLIG